ncbi:MAG: hypothetical protein DRJ38_03970 [Thermoprotei archaeon]|nr:MAG: hypothetical protein DRJ38_03970 [Thermoprotei archaeon]
MMELYHDNIAINYVLKRRKMLTKQEVNLLVKFDKWCKMQGHTTATRYKNVTFATRLLIYMNTHGLQIEDLNNKYENIVMDFLDTLNVSRNTIIKYFIVSRTFARFLRDRFGMRIVIKNKIPKTKEQLPEVLSEEEIMEIIYGIQNPKFKLFFALTYETGARRSEMINIKLKHIKMYENYAEIEIPQSKSEPRVVPVVLFYPMLKRYLDTHPAREYPESYLFFSNRNVFRPMSLTTICNFFDDLSEKYGRRITPHILRHSRGTQLATLGLVEKEIMAILGHRTRRMVDKYIHLAGRDARSRLLEIYGIKKRTCINNVKCQRCGHVNPAGARYCVNCAHPLTLESAHEYYRYQKKFEKIIQKLEKIDLEKLEKIL